MKTMNIMCDLCEKQLDDLGDKWSKVTVEIMGTRWSMDVCYGCLGKDNPVRQRPAELLRKIIPQLSAKEWVRAPNKTGS